MSDFREQVLAKLRQLNTTQQSIESTANWCLFYNKDARVIVSIWDDEFARTTPDKKVAQLYLANHILQEGRKKGREFSDEYSRVMARAVKDAASTGEDKARKAVERLVDIWESRRVFGSGVVAQLKDSMVKGKAAAAAAKEHKQHAASQHGGKQSTQNGNDIPGKHLQVLGALATTVSDVNAAADKSAQIAAKVLQLKPRLHLEGTSVEVGAGRDVLNAAVAALQSEVKARQLAIAELRLLIGKQEEAVHKAQNQLKQFQEQQAGLNNRIKVLDSIAAASRPAQPPAPAPQPTQLPPPFGAMLPMGAQVPLPMQPGPGLGMGAPALGLLPPPGFPLGPGLNLPLGVPSPDAMLAALGMQTEQLAAVMAAQQARPAPMPQQLLMLPQQQQQQQQHGQQAGLGPQSPGQAPSGGGTQQHVELSRDPRAPHQQQQQQQQGQQQQQQPAAQPWDTAANAAAQLVADQNAAAMLAQALAALPQEERQKLAMGFQNNSHTDQPTSGTNPPAEGASNTAAQLSSHVDDLMQDADFAQFILGEQRGPQSGPGAHPPAAAPAIGGDDDDYDPDNPF